MINFSVKGILFDIRRFSVNDGPGIRTTLFLKGCPLSCWWCHNPEGRECYPEKALRTNKIGSREFSFEEQIGNELTVSEVVDELLKDIIVFEESEGGVTFSGGEPFYQFEFLKNLLMILKSYRIHTTVDTSGYTSKENIIEVMDYIDLFLFDLKNLDNDEHIKYTGVPNNGILDNFNFLIQNNKKIIVRVPVIPGVNDTASNINQLKKFLSLYTGFIKELHLLPYHSSGLNKYKKLNLENKFELLPGLKKKDIEYLIDEFGLPGLKVKIGG